MKKALKVIETVIFRTLVALMVTTVLFMIYLQLAHTGLIKHILQSLKIC